MHVNLSMRKNSLELYTSTDTARVWLFIVLNWVSLLKTEWIRKHRIAPFRLWRHTGHHLQDRNQLCDRKSHACYARAQKQCREEKHGWTSWTPNMTTNAKSFSFAPPSTTGFTTHVARWHCRLIAGHDPCIINNEKRHFTFSSNSSILDYTFCRIPNFAMRSLEK